MYKISILLIIIGLVTGCSKPVTYQVENSAEIVFEVTNAQYGNAIISLWNETYPEQVGAISYDVVEANDSFELHLAKQPISNDVILVDDIYVPSLFDESLAFESKEQKSYEMEIPYRLTKSFNEYKNTFIPMRLEGMAYAYNTNLLHSSDVLSFERLARLANNAVYINKDEVSILPLLYIGGVNLLADGNVELPYFNSDKTLNLLKEIQWLGTHFDAFEQQGYYDSWFIDEKYASGLVHQEMQLVEYEEMFKHDLKVTKIPKLGLYPSPTVASMEGYLINANTEYPNTAKALIQLMRSEKGMQAYASYNDVYLAVVSKDVYQIDYQDNWQEEFTYALSDSMPTPFRSINREENLTSLDYYMEGDFVEIIAALVSGDITAYEAQSLLIMLLGEWNGSKVD